MNWILLMPNTGPDRKQITLATVLFCYGIAESRKFVLLLGDFPRLLLNGSL